MVKRRDVFQAIADPTRRSILTLVSKQSVKINDLVEKFDSSRPTISKHIKLLVECELIVVHKRGRERYCEAKLQKLDEVSDWVKQCKILWAEKFDNLDNYLTELQSKPNKTKE